MMNRFYFSASSVFLAALFLAACDPNAAKTPEPEPEPNEEVPNPSSPPCESAISHSGSGTLAWDSRIAVYQGKSLGPTSGSPIRMDVNDDGCADIVFGAAGDEFRLTEAGGRFVRVPKGKGYAIDGVTGELLWEVEAVGELFALPASIERANGNKAVVLAGRLAALIGVDAQTGEQLWAFDPAEGTIWGYPLNFFNPIAIADQDGDGTQDVFVAYGGYDLAEPGEARPASYFGVISGETGRWITKRRTPDLAETYMSPFLRKQGGSARDSWKFLVGTGGETLVGGFWEISLADLFAEDTGEPYGRRLVAGTDAKGVIAPPTVGEFREEGKMDIIAPMFEGRILLLDGLTDEVVWEVELVGEELMSAPAPVQLSEDEWGVAIFTLVGVYPSYNSAYLRILKANNGEIVEEIEHQTRLAGSPVSAKVSSAECDDVIWGTTEFAISKLYHWSCADGSIREEEYSFGTLATPILLPRLSGGLDLGWLGTDTSSPDDPTHDWDVIEEDPAYPMEFFTVALTDSPSAEITWGAYMGNGSGLFLRR